MDKKTNKIISLWGIVFVAMLLFAAPFINPDSVFAQPQETCPDTGDWVKVEGLSGENYLYTAPEGYLVAETCYKAGTEVVYKTIDPPQASVTVISTVGHDLSHASFRLVEEPTPTPTETFTPTPTETFTPTPTNTPTFTPTPTEEMEFVPLSLSGLCSGAVASLSVASGEANTIIWSVANNNDQDISFTWLANNGQSGSGTAPANGSTSFMTDIDGTSVALEYALNEEPFEKQANVDPCDPQQETEEPTPTATQEPSPVPTDSEPDQPAGGSGPSLVGSLLPFVVGFSGIATLSTILIARKKNNQSQ